jgi:hypothetical protein
MIRSACHLVIGVLLLGGVIAQGVVGQDRDRDRGRDVEESVDDEEAGRSMREGGEFDSRLLPSRPDRDRRWFLGVEVESLR